jgi:hypothetical protein
VVVASTFSAGPVWSELEQAAMAEIATRAPTSRRAFMDDEAKEIGDRRTDDM